MLPINLDTVFEDAFKNEVIPFAKKLGFKRKHHRFYRKVNDIFQCFDIQKNVYNSHFEYVSYTFNIGFFNQAIWNIAWNDDGVVSFPTTLQCFIRGRLGAIAHQKDYWYELKQDGKTAEVVSQMKSDIENHLLPFFEKYDTFNGLVNIVEEFKGFCYSGNIHTGIAFLMLTGQIEKGKKVVTEYFHQAQEPKIVTNSIRHPDGRVETKIVKTYINHALIETIKKIADLYKIELT